MKKLNKTEVKALINFIKNESIIYNKIKINVYRAIKEFILKRINNIYKINQELYIILNNDGNGWLYNINNLMNIDPLPNNKEILFCGFCESNDDIFHYWLKDKKTLKKYNITYNDYKNFNSRNWFITYDGKLYINNKYYELKGAKNAK